MEERSTGRLKRGLVFILSVCFLITVKWKYNESLNNQIKVVQEEIMIHDLPEELKGFTILQVTDLHGKNFGENQERLLAMINQIEYDVLAITGDMGDLNYDPDGQALKQLIVGLTGDGKVVYIEGNHGPFVKDREKGTVNELGEWLESRGVDLLMDPVAIDYQGTKIWIAEQTIPFYQPMGFEGITEEDTLIGLMHYPMNEYFYENQSKNEDFPSYDLILAGHYHGGQWRIPGLGALFISDVNGDNWFPSQERVSGLTEWSGYKQYVSRGLGASGSNPLIKQRWFNPPEINVLILTNESSN